ncbi:MAG: oxidoreductase [Rhodospirillaceae bacterium]|jgi:Fe-S-cluster-containing dehydrogenase component|nr:oxidoreductase [Rhodospirillaceae bacterium]MBT5945507.1 oxidoreductase [Rhodospirillaceae bacterium]MBT6404237.1 oxidoreductase [Rhodospirillaceae bacterium]MBT6535118.1 oxidoreductase [Rhodospirillaceae bacterium]MBT7360362.1 oxidoreductase [Rhodospirillaceae bacterium]
MSQAKWNLIVDVANCTNCNNCTLAVQDEHVGNSFAGYAAEMPKHGHRWIDIKRRERGQGTMTDVAYLPTMCQHCDDAPCIAAAKDDAIKKRADGIVVIDPDKSKGQKQIVDACPYGAIFWNDELDIPQHWIFDAHLLDAGWTEPRCVDVCPTGALRSLKVDDGAMQKVSQEEGLEPLRPDLDTKPRVHYKNLWRYAKCFVGGTVSSERDGLVDCVEGARVVLSQDGKPVAETTTDGYGDFKFDQLDADSGAYTIEITADGLAAERREATLGESINLGEIRLGK